MPIFDFACNRCGEVFEDMTSSREDTPLCVKCFSTDVKAVVSTPHVHVEKSPFDAVNRGPGGRIYSGKYAKSKTTDH